MMSLLLLTIPATLSQFNDTVGQNIRYGNPQATQEQIEAAARMANAHDFISSFPQGYDTHVGDKGSQLSGG
jgi:ABC-type multidrug transport system fused ATPase/permease subunit